MRVGKDTYIIKVDTPKRDTIGVAGIKIDTDYNKYKHATQVGTIVACPVALSDQYEKDGDLKEGDSVVFHHFICQPNHKIDENVYRCEYLHIYGKIDNVNLQAIEDVIFVKPILEPEENMFMGGFQIKPHREYLPQQGIVYSASKKANARGVYAGDKVFFTKNADYEMNIHGTMVYRMRIRNIVSIERNGKLVSFKDRLIVKPFLPKTQFMDARVSSQLFGEVQYVGDDIKGVNVGDIIGYYNGVNGDVIHNGEKYAFIELRNINYLKQDNMAKPILDRIMIKQDDAPAEINGFIIPDTAKEKPKRGIVVAVGPGAIGNDGKPLPMQTKVGDHVIYGEFAGANITIDDQPYVIVKESELILIL